MKDTELYRQILGISPPWKVSRVELEINEQEAKVYVEAGPEAVWLCPECKRPCSGYDSREQRTWRHLDSCEFRTWLIASVPRIRCPEHGVKSVDVPWSQPYSRFTLAFECFALHVLQLVKVQARAATLLGLTPAEMNELMHRATLRGLKRQKEEKEQQSDTSDTKEALHLSLDEKSFGEGQQYLTVLADSEAHQVLEVAQSRTCDATEQLITNTLTPTHKQRVTSVTMDMWQPFIQACQKALPHVDIVHDRFHVAQYLNDAVDKTRREEDRRLRREQSHKQGQRAGAKRQSTPLTHTRYLWLYNPEDLSLEKKVRLEELQQMDLETAKVWSCKEAFRDFYALLSVEEGREFFKKWYNKAVAVGNQHLTKVAEQLRLHLEGLLAYLRHHTTNAVAEELNSEIQAIKTAARGFRDFDNYRMAILFFLGKLEIYPHNFP